MSDTAILTAGSQAPMTLEELHDIGGLGENVIKEYGERLVKVVKNFVEMENLQEYIANRPKKRPRTETPTGKVTSNPSQPIDVCGDDEFDVGIDFSMIPIPDTKLGSSSSKSPYF